jgi:hypothetical protein
MLSLDDQRHLLYTHGSVPFYGTYPACAYQYRKRSAPSTANRAQTSSPRNLLAITKVNWNQTQLNTRKPVTLETSKRVGDILRRLLADIQPQARYAFYLQ